MPKRKKYEEGRIHLVSDDSIYRAHRGSSVMIGNMTVTRKAEVMA